MAYTISKASDLTGINPTTIRYYDKEGLLPGIQRMNGIRLFTDEDIKWLHVLSCLKNTGMPISRIREYARLAVLNIFTFLLTILGSLVLSLVSQTCQCFLNLLCHIFITNFRFYNRFLETVLDRKSVV